MVTVDESPPFSAEITDGLHAGAAKPKSPDPVPETGPPGKPRRWNALFAASLFVASVVVCLVGYLALTVPASWFPSASSAVWGARDLTLARGSGRILGDDLLVTAVDPSGIAVMSVNASLRAIDFPAVAWMATDIDEDADVRMIWRTDIRPGVDSAAVMVIAGRTMPVMLAKNAAWVGRVTGLALVIRTQLPKPIRIGGVVAKSMGATEILHDRAREWLSFEGWSGTSINTVVGGTDAQDLPLPPLLAVACAIAGALLLTLRHWRPGLTAEAARGLLLFLFAVAWLLLDARWTWNLVRQEAFTLRDYGGKSLRDKHLAADDAPLFTFVENVRHVLPETPVRVIVVAKARYFRERAAYHLYPHNVFTDRVNGAMPAASALRPGDWLLDYEARGILYDPASGNLRWNGDQTIPAEPKLIIPGAALFLIR